MYSPLKITRIMMVAYIAAICFLCFGNFSTPGFDVPQTFFGIPADKAVHFAMYVPFVPLFYFSFSPKKRSPIVLVAGFLSALAFGAFIELIQGMTDYRSKDILDFVADGIGTFLGLIIAVMVVFLKKYSYEND